MTSLPFRATALALFFAFPALAPARTPRTDPPDKKVVVEDDDLVVDVDDPVVVRVGAGRGYLGLRLLEITPELRAHFGAPRDAGVLVAEVEPDSAAAKAGVAVGDVITSVDGEKVNSARELSRTIRRKKAGETVKLDIARDRAAKHVTVTVQERKRSDFEIGEFRDMRDGVLREFRRRPLLGEEDRGRLEEKLRRLEDRLNELEKRLSR